MKGPLHSPVVLYTISWQSLNIMGCQISLSGMGKQAVPRIPQSSEPRPTRALQMPTLGARSCCNCSTELNADILISSAILSLSFALCTLIFTIQTTSTRPSRPKWLFSHVCVSFFLFNVSILLLIELNYIWSLCQSWSVLIFLCLLNFLFSILCACLYTFVVMSVFMFYAFLYLCLQRTLEGRARVSRGSVKSIHNIYYYNHVFKNH